MPMHPHAKPSFRNLFWYPFKITLITALRTFPFFGKLLGKRLDWGYHNSEHPEFLSSGDISRASKTSKFNDITAQTLHQTELLRTCSQHSGSHKLFNTLTSDLRRWNLGSSFLGTTTGELVLFGKHALHVNCV